MQRYANFRQGCLVVHFSLESLTTLPWRRCLNNARLQRCGEPQCYAPTIIQFVPPNNNLIIRLPCLQLMPFRVERLEKLMFSFCYQRNERRTEKKFFLVVFNKLEERRTEKWEEEVVLDSSCHFHKLRNSTLKCCWDLSTRQAIPQPFSVFNLSHLIDA